MYTDMLDTKPIPLHFGETNCVLLYLNVSKERIKPFEITFFLSPDLHEL